MRSKFWILFLLALSGCGIPANFRGPGMLDRSVVGNGTDLANDEQVAAWFLGIEPIRYCLRWDPNFGLSKGAAQKIIRDSFARWSRYLDKKKLNNAKLHPNRGGVLLDPPLRMHAQQLLSCDGTEELTFWLGTEDEIVRARRERYDRPVAFAERLTYDLDAARGTGFVWIASANSFTQGAPDWKFDGSALGAIVMHELGHVAGSGHVDGTIMDPRIFRLVNFYADRRGSDFHLRYQNIHFIDLWGFKRMDRYRELLLCDGCEFAKPGWNKLEDHRTFEKSIGRRVPEYGYVISSMSAKKENAESLEFQLWAHHGSPSELAPFGNSFTVKKFTRTATFKGEGVVFRQQFRRPGDREPTTLESRSDGYVAQGDVTGANGAIITVVLKRNVYGETMRLDWVDDEGKLRPIYELETVLKSYGIDL